MGYVLIRKKPSQEYGLNTMVNMVFLLISVFCFMFTDAFQLQVQNFVNAQFFLLSMYYSCYEKLMDVFMLSCSEEEK